MICESGNVAAPGPVAILTLRTGARCVNVTIARAMSDTPGSPLHVKHRLVQGGASRIFLAVLAAVAALSGAEFYALWQSNHRHTTSDAAARQTLATPSATEIAKNPRAPDTAAVVAPEIVGWVDEPIQDTLVGN